ncbi:MAG: hypothetical protein ACRCYU_14880 [Nocardioides sp.]
MTKSNIPSSPALNACIGQIVVLAQLLEAELAHDDPRTSNFTLLLTMISDLADGAAKELLRHLLDEHSRKN